MESNKASRPHWILGIVLVLAGCGPIGGGAPDVSLLGGWQQEFLGTDPDVVFYPDSNVNYWTYRLNRSRVGNDVGIKIQGAYPQVRYMGINVYDDVYDDESLSPVGSLVDVSVDPDPGSVNPFLQEEWPDYYPANYYTVYVVPEGTVVPGATNVIEYGADLQAISIFLRYYLPGIDARGGFPLPTLSAFDTQTGEPVDLPRIGRKPLDARVLLQAYLQQIAVDYAAGIIEPWFSLNAGNRLLAYRTSGAGLYPNNDNLYLTIPITKAPDEVAVLRFKPPSFPRRNGEIGQTDVRYWSISLGDRETFNHWTLFDDEAKVDDDGFVRIVIGPPTPEVMAKAGPHNFIPWEIGEQGVLLYRNLLTRAGFAGGISRVPELGDGGIKRLFAADLYIGEYAPSGALLSVSEFLDSE